MAIAVVVVLLLGVITLGPLPKDAANSDAQLLSETRL